MRVGVVIAVILLGIAPARADPTTPPLDCLALGDYAADGTEFTPLDRPIAMGVAEVDGELRLSTAVTRLFDATAYSHLDDSLPTTVAIHVLVTRVGSTVPLATRTITRTAHHDVWDEGYKVTFDDAPPRPVKYRADALALLTTLTDVPLLRLDELPAGAALSVGIVAELDPISARSLAEIQSWIGGTSFGRMVSWFVDPAHAADRVLRVEGRCPLRHLSPTAQPTKTHP